MAVQRRESGSELWFADNGVGQRLSWIANLQLCNFTCLVR